MNNMCPVCQKDDAIQRVVAVVQAGQSSGMYFGPSGGITHADGKWGTVSGYTTLSGSTTSDLARLLAPPKEPVKDTATFQTGCGVGLVFVTIVGGFTAGWALSGATAGEIFAAIIRFLVIGILGILILRSGIRKRKSSDEQYPHAIAKWEKAKVCWQRLYFCHRDGIVFDPESSKTCQPTQIREFIYE